MTITNNHTYFVLDTVFQNRHKELFDFFEGQGAYI